MSIAKLYDVFKILILIETFSILNSKLLSKTTRAIDKSEIEELKIKNKNIMKKNNFLLNLFKGRDLNNFIFDLDNIIKFEDTKKYFNKKILDLNQKYQVELSIFIFENFNKNIEKIFEIKNTKRSILRNIPTVYNDTVTFKENQENIRNNKNNNQTKTKKIFNKKENFFIKKNTKNFENRIRNFNLSQVGISEREKENNNQKYSKKSPELSKEKDKKNFLLSDFLYKNNLINSDNSILILISKNEFLIKIFLGSKLVDVFSFNEERKVAENFLKSFIDGNIEFALDELVYGIENLIKNKYPILIIKAIILFFIIGLSLGIILIKNKRQLKNKKSNKDISNNLCIIREITERNLKNRNIKEFSDDCCMICLEEIPNIPKYQSQLNILQKKNKTTEKSEDLDDSCACSEKKENKDGNPLEFINLSNLMKNQENKCQKENNKIYAQFQSEKLEYFKNDLTKVTNSFEYFSIAQIKLHDSETRFKRNSLNIDKHFFEDLYHRKSEIIDKNLELKDPNKTDLVDQSLSYSDINEYNKIINIKEKDEYIIYKLKNFTEKSLINLENSISKYYDLKIENIVSFNIKKEDQTKNSVIKAIISSNQMIYMNNGQIENKYSNTNQNIIKISNFNEHLSKEIHQKHELQSSKTNKKKETKKENFFAILNCGHKFHSNCLALWMLRGTLCPICRTPIMNKHNLKEFNYNILNENSEDDDSIMILM